MKKLLYICAFTLTFAAPIDSVHAANSANFRDSANSRSNSSPMRVAASNCSAKANAMASSYSNARILSVKKSGNSCIIVIKVNGKNGNPPRVIRKTTSG